MNRTLRNTSILAFLLCGCLALLASCNLPQAESALTPTLNVTQAYQTVEARLTGAATQALDTTQTSPPTDSGLATQTPSQTATPPSPLLTSTLLWTSTPSQRCDQAAPGNPIDVTIPDDTQMQPNQVFTKIWRLQNSGTCTWTRSYSVTFFSGEQMSAPASVPLSGEVLPGQSVDISVDMVAPSTAGRYQGNWKLRNAGNVLFGIGPSGSAPFWVRIEVVQTSTPTTTPQTPTPTISPTATPAILISGTSVLTPGQNLNLDTNQINDGGEDVSYTSTAEGEHMLIPLGSALVGIYGANQPSLANCQAASLSAAALTIEDIPVGSYLCYRTGQGLPGRARLINLNPDTEALTLDILTWLLP